MNAAKHKAQKPAPRKACGKKKSALRPAKPERTEPVVRYGRELNDAGDERSWMDWVTPEQIKVAAREPARGFVAEISRQKRRTRAFQRRTGMMGIKSHKGLVAANTRRHTARVKLLFIRNNSLFTLNPNCSNLDFGTPTPPIHPENVR